jgi:hypothetical protein
MPKIAELKEGDEVSGIYMVQESEYRHFSSKPGRYLRMRVSDDSGTIYAICFDPDIMPFATKVGMRISIQAAKVTDFKGKLRLHFLPGAINKI